MKYIDIHSHVYFPDYDADREEVISRALNAGIGIITVGTDLESSRKALVLAETHENMWAVVGMHPVDAGEAAIFDYDAFKKLASHPKVVAIGECGLDYFHISADAQEAAKSAAMQRDIFVQHITLANEIKKPLMLHVRNGKKTAQTNRNAYAEALVVLKEHAKVAVNFHFFAGTSTDLKDIIDAGYNVSFTGVITFARDYDDLIKKVPLDRVMSETDAPFVSPTPYRGKRNEPGYVVEVVKKMAEIRGEEVSIVAATLVKNAKKFFSI